MAYDTAHSPDPLASDSSWLNRLGQHSVFALLERADDGQAQRASSSTSSSGVGTSRSVLALRGTDVLVAQGSQVRIASLSEAKNAASAAASSSTASAYKVLEHDAGSFDIASLVVNPTGRLVALVGAYQVAVLVLPRPAATRGAGDERKDGVGAGTPAYVRALGTSVSCTAARVGAYYHDDRTATRIAKVLWHPWGADGCSLLVLTADGVLREYDTSSDLTEPTQTVALVPARSGSLEARVARMGVSDDDGRTAVSFALGLSGSGEAQANWEPLSVFGVTQAGDVHAALPFLPTNASVPSRYLSSLSSYLTQLSHEAAPAERAASLRYLTALLRQTRMSGATPSYLRSVTPGSAMDLDPRASEAPEEDDFSSLPPRVLLRSPAAHPPARQGPFLMAPAPHELSEEREARATDMLVLRVAADPEITAGGVAPAPSGAYELDATALSVLAIVSDDGRVDFGVLPSSLSPQWGKRTKRAGRYGLSLLDEDESQSEEAQDLPTLLVYESVNLGLLSTLQSALPAQRRADGAELERLLALHAPTFVADPLYSDTLYVHHSLGAHALCVGGWARALLEATTADEGAGDETFYDDSQADLTLSRPSGRALAIRRVLHRRKPSQVVWAVKTPAPQPGASPAVRPICGLVITSDVYLSYALLAIAAPSIPVALELNMRVFDTPSEPEPLGLALGSDKPRSGYTSLLGDGPAFEVPTPFKALSSLPVAPKAVARGGAELQVTPETLRELGSTASRMREQMRVVVGAGNAVQARLDLQMREMARMLDKLAEVRRRTRAVARGGPSGGEAMQRRLEEALRRQGEIVARTDRVLQRLMDAHQPVLSVYERKWFAELERLAKEVGVSAEQGKPLTGLVAHADKLDYQLSHLKPSLRSIAEKEAQEKAQAPPVAMGTKQLASMELMLTEETGLLDDAKATAQQLAARIAKETSRHGRAAGTASVF